MKGVCKMKFAIGTALLASLFQGTAASLPCPTTVSQADSALEYELSDIGKLSILGFHSSISYITSDSVSIPLVKIVGASETPVVTTDASGLLTIARESCEATVEDPAPGTDDAPSESSSFRASSLAAGYLMNMIFPTRLGGALLATTLASSLLPTVWGAGHEMMDVCMPALDIEITMPIQSQVTEKFGETDHYLAATLDTVTWGYFDPNATAVISIESGETITVEVITHHSSHDWAKIIRGDPAVEEIFYWEAGQALESKPEPKLPGTGVHLITGPIEVVGAEVGDVVQIDILELDPRPNPETGRTFGTNSQKFAGYQFRVDTKRDGTPYSLEGGTEAITVFEYIQDDDGNRLYGKPVYMCRFPNMTAPDGSIRNIDNQPSVTVPHECFSDTVVIDEGGIQYLSPDPAALNWKVPLRPHIGTLAVMPNNTANYIGEGTEGGANSIPPARFGGNIDDWRIGKGGTLYLNVEVDGANILVGDTHAAQGDSELAGTAMETSMTTKLRITLHKAGNLPKQTVTMPFPLLETSTQFVVHGFAFDNYLDQLEVPSTIFQEGASLDLAFEDCFLKTRAWMMDTFDLTEEETIAIMTTGVDFGVTQVVDGNWGAHADIPKWMFEEGDAPFDYSCTPAGGPGRRHLEERSRRRSLRTTERRQLLEEFGVDASPEEYAKRLYDRVTQKCESCKETMDRHALSHKMLDAKLHFAKAKKEGKQAFAALEKLLMENAN